jgi:outer membrane receptor protein involved in Fe transport
MFTRAAGFVLFFILLAHPNVPFAAAQPSPQGHIIGTVLGGDDGEALINATVTLLDADGGFLTGTATGTDGSFRLDQIRPGLYGIRVSYIGYHSRTFTDVRVRPAIPTDLGTIRLETDNAQLDGVEVVAERDFIEQRADRTIYNVADQAITAGGSVIETLQTLPSIEVDTEGNLSLRGNQNVAIHINGRPVPVRGAMLAAMLRQISADNVERVEVIPNPSARYEPEGMSGIINIVLKQGTNRGLSGGLTTGMGSAPSGEITGSLAYQRGKWDVFGSYGYRYDAFRMDGRSTRIQYPSEDLMRQEMLIDNATGSHLFNGTADYTLAAGTILGIRTSLGVRDGSADQGVDYLMRRAVDGERRAFRSADGDVGGLNGDASVNFTRTFRGEEHDLKAEARITRNADERSELFSYEVATDPDAASIHRSGIDNLTLNRNVSADYRRTAAGFRLEAGSRLSHRRLDNDRLYERFQDDAFVPVPGRSAEFGYDEAIYAGYVQAARGFGRLELQAGLRGEIAERTISLAGEPLNNRFDALYPSAFALYNIAPGTLLKASYSRRVSRPQTSALNPIPQFDDEYYVDTGNPHLRPAYTNAYELTAQAFYFLTVTPFYRRTTDVIRRRVFFDAESGVTTTTFQNLDESTSYGADATLMGMFGPVRGMVSTSAYRAVTEGGSADTGVMSDAFIWTVRGGVQVRPRAGTEVQLFGFYRAPTDTEDGRMSAFGVVVAGLRQQLWSEQLSVSVRMNDVFNTSRFTFNTSNGDYMLEGIRDPQIRHVTASLTYTFGQASPRRRQPAEQQLPAGIENIGY